MAEPHQLKGASCTATLDTEAQTLTFVHSGFGAFDEQKARSPVVVPLGAIDSVDYKRGALRSWFAVTLRGESPWLHGISKDPNGLTCGDDPTPFAEAVKRAVGAVTPLEEGAWEPPEAPDVPPARPGWGRRAAKSVAVAVVEGFFSSR